MGCSLYPFCFDCRVFNRETGSGLGVELLLPLPKKRPAVAEVGLDFFDADGFDLCRRVSVIEGIMNSLRCLESQREADTREHKVS